ncbi:hypothetical protein GCM10009853_010380 [Glycomyces scopariae]
MADMPLSQAERAELERLRAEAVRGPGRGRRGARWFGSTLLLILAALLAVASVVVLYARDQLLDTDRYVATVAPLAEDPEIRAAVADRVGEAVNERLDVEGYVARALDAIQTEGAPEALDALAGPVAAAVEGFVDDQVHTVVYSDRFAQLWTNANTTAHEAVAAILRGEASESLQLQGDTVYLDLGPLVEQVKDLLVARGLTIAERLPQVSVQFPLVEVKGIANAQGAAALLDVLRWVLPLAAIALLLAGVLLAPGRRRALLVGALLLAAAMALLLAGAAVARTAALANLPEDVRSPQAVAAVYDIVTRFLLAGAQTVIVAALVVAVAAWLAGPGRAATAIRGAAALLLDLAAAGLVRTGLPLGPVPGAAARSRRTLEAVAVAAAVVWLILWPHRGVEGTLWVAFTLMVVVAVIEVLARADRRRHRTPAPTSAPAV